MVRQAAGKGAFATRTIEKGERIIEYLGERLTHAESDARYDDHDGDDCSASLTVAPAPW